MIGLGLRRNPLRTLARNARGRTVGSFRRAVVAVAAVAVIAGSPGLAPVAAGTSTSVPQAAVASPDITIGGSCSMWSPFGVSAAPSFVAPRPPAVSSPSFDPKEATSETPLVLRKFRSPATSHVVPGSAANSPTTGYSLVTTPAAVATVKISGTVTGPDGLPLAGIAVMAYGSGYYSAATIADGTYSVDVSAGSYLLYFSDENGAHPAGYYAEAGFVADYHDATEVILGADVAGIDVQLPTPIWITGTVTGPAGTGIGQISVAAYSSAFDNGGTTTSHDDGTYAIAVTPGTYLVGFADEAGTYASGYRGVSGYTPNGTAAEPIVVTAADVTGIDAQLPLAIHISGVVRSPAGAPLANITVGILGNTSVAIGKTGIDGSYSLVAAAGSYYVAVVDPSNTYPMGYYSTTGFKASSSAATKVTVTTSDVPGINVTFPVPIYARGTITGPGALPLAGITVYAESSTYLGGATSAANGTWSIPVVAGTFVVSFSDDAELYASGFYSTTGFKSTSGLASPVVVTTATVNGLNVQLPPMAHIQGVVTGTGDVPVPNIEVTSYAGYSARRTITAADGSYTLAASPGSYHIAVRDPSGTYVRGYYASTGFTADSNAASAVAVASTDVTGINVKLPTPVFIHGTVTGPGGVPLKGIDVLADSTVYSSGTTTASNGTFAVSVVAATYHVSFCDQGGVYGSGYFSDGGYTSDPNAASPVHVGATDRLGVNVELPPAIHITGKVTGPGGVPLPDIDVSIESQTIMTEAVTGADGTYSAVVTAGAYIVTFYDFSGAYQRGYYSDAGFTTDPDAASAVTVTDADVTGVDVEMTVNVPPTARISTLPIWAATTSIGVRWSATMGSNPVVAYDVRYRRAAWNGDFGSYVTWKSETGLTSATFAGAAGSTYCFSARAWDWNGTPSAWTAETCTAVPLDDRSLQRSSGWTAKTGTAYYRSTYLTATRLGSKLTRSGVAARRIAVVATTCPTCGTIKVYLGSTLLKTISLKSTRTVNKKVITVAVFTTVRSGTLVIKVASSGKKTIIDGVLIRRN